MKLFAAIPAYDGKVCAATARALIDEQAVAGAAGVELRVAFLPGCSLITHARNQLAHDFMESDCDRLVFIDADVSWEPGSVCKLAAHDKDFVGGAYRFKADDEGYPVGWLDNPELWAEDGLLEVASLPGGFLCLTRHVFETLADPDRLYQHHQFTGFGYFHAPITGGRLYGEDTAFCADWRAKGGKVWLDPELSLSHHGGNATYAGHIGNWLRGRNGNAG